MEVLQHDYYYWKIIQHYVINEGFRVLEMRGKEVWLEDDRTKPRKVLRLVRADIDWANTLRKDVGISIKRFEIVRKHLRLSKIIGENIYVSMYPPVDSWEDIKKTYTSPNQKTTVSTSLITRGGAEEVDEGKDRMLPDVSDLDTVSDLEQAIAQIKREIKQITTRRNEKENSLFHYGKPTATNALLFSIAVMFFVLEFNGGSTSILTLIEYGAKYNPLIVSGEWWRFISAMFLHIGFLHVIMNSLALYYLGGAVERMYGTGRFLFIYFIAGLFGSVASFAFNDNVAAGASGAIFGCFGALLYFGTVHKKLFFRTMGKNLFVILALNLAFGLAVPMIDNGAHVGGLVGGFLASAFVHLPKHKWSMKQLGALILMALSVAALFWHGLENDQKNQNALLPLQIGQEYIQREEIEKAYPFVKQAVEEGADMPEATFLLGYLEATFENYEVAKQLFQETIDKRPEFHQAHYNLSLIYLELGEVEKAKEAVAKAIELEPTDEKYQELKEKIE